MNLARPTGAANLETISERHRQILIVDDDPEARTLLARLLACDGYLTTALASAEEALEFLNSTTPALVITDYDMPGMDGLNLFKEMRDDPRHREIPVIMFSAHGGTAREAALIAGVDAYLIKGSLDWALLEQCVFELAGPGPLERRLPEVSSARARSAG